MPLRSQITTKLSARSVYSKQVATKKTAEKGRGRPRKYPNSSPMKVMAGKIVKKGRGRPRKSLVSPVKAKSNLQTKKSPKTRKRKSSVTFKNTAEIIENNSSEADLSSEGEETDDEGPVNNAKQSNNAEVAGNENGQKDEEESSGEEGDIEDDICGEEIKSDVDVGEIDSDELIGNGVDENIGIEIDLDEKELDSDNDEDVCYSFPEPNGQFTTNNEMINYNEEDINDSDISRKKKNKVKLKKNIKKDKILNPEKRRISEENYEEVEGQNKIKPKKKKKMLKDDGEKIFSTPGSSRLSSFSPFHLFDQARPSTSSFRPSVSSPLPRVDSIESLIRFNKTAPCGNVAADQAFRWLISPTLPGDFFYKMFEKMPFVVQRENSDYYKGLFSGNDLNIMLKEHNLEYGVHIDIVKYVKGQRIPIVGGGRAYYSNVWEDYKQGYSLRVRNPQSYNKNLWKLCTLLQEYFSSTVGCNIYLTPPKAQGFPPHYDDIDAFIIQVEGKKYWKVYAPRSPQEELARYSSRDFTQNEIGNPILQVCLNAGEMLYIPRGYIHQAVTDASTHSLHLTFSTNQLNTWGDLLLIAATKAVEKAILNDVTFRESIPKDDMDYLGSAVADSKAFKRYELVNKSKDLAKKAMSYIDIDEAADLHYMKFIQTALPPAYNKIEKDHSLHGNGSYWKNGEIRVKGMIKQSTEIQLIRRRVLRLVIEDEKPKLYHAVENQRDPKTGAEESLATYIELEMECVPSYLCLLNKYPDFVKVKDLPFDDLEERISFATSLYENGLIMTKEPLPHSDDNDFDWTLIPDIIPTIKKEHS